MTALFASFPHLFAQALTGATAWALLVLAFAVVLAGIGVTGKLH